jgi:hypothetical protein
MIPMAISRDSYILNTISDPVFSKDDCGIVPKSLNNASLLLQHDFCFWKQRKKNNSYQDVERNANIKYTNKSEMFGLLYYTDIK